MTWSDFYLICFIVGLLLSVFSLVLGDLHLHLHLPFHFHFGHFDFGGMHADVPQGSAGHVASGQLPVINFGTITAFLAWFGGIGYLLTRHSQLYALTALGISIIGGLVGGTVVFLFISRILMKHEHNMDPADYDMVGVLGKITSSVFAGGTGELVYVQDGARHACGARAEDGSAINKGVEVVVTRYEKGIAYVKPWAELAEDEISSSTLEQE